MVGVGHPVVCLLMYPTWSVGDFKESRDRSFLSSVSG